MSAQSAPLASGKSKFLGGATSSNISSYLAKYFNQVTPGNDGKWGSVEGTRGQFNWTNLDKIYNFAMDTTRNMFYKHHCLIWGQQQPSWISSLDSATQRAEIEEWIQAVGARYPKMTQVDVVNEPIMAPPSYKDALCGDGETGWDWGITAFELARQYCDSSVQLVLNEYNVLHDNARTGRYLEIINLLKERDLIDGIGIQGHYFEFRSDISSTSQYVYDVNVIKYNLNRLVASGLPVYITEFDIDEPDDANQLAQYQIYFPIFWGN
ncbi:MAG: endo-1,4-beta-xylanase, partial [Candidatus Marinimicrobia bacterium]|nr:endo-1,4-beta-xylanase [Candidatus Neomarinimicrobiota bacterium]